MQSYRSCYAKILKLGLPILVGQLGMIVTGFADNIMVGRYSTEALASASFVNNFFNMAVLCLIGFTYGLTPLVGAMFSRHDSDAIGRTMRTGLRVNIVFSILITAVMGAIYFFLPRMGQPEELLPLIKPYYLLFLAGLLPITIFNVFAQWSYAVQNTRLPMWIILAANTLNVLGNWLLIYGKFGFPELGLTGAGIATLLSRWLCPIVIVAAFAFSRNYACYRKGWAKVCSTAASLGEIVRTSFPVAAQLTFETASFSIAAIMAGWIGAVELAAYQIIVITGTLGFTIYYGVGAAVSVLVSNAAGVGDKETMRHTAWAGYHMLLAIMLLSSTVFLLFGRTLFVAFSSDELVLAVTSTLIFPLILYQSADATQINFANALRGTSNVMPMMWISFTAYIVVGLPATYLLAFTAGLGIYGIVLSFTVSLLTAACLFLYFFLRTTRK